MNKINLLLTTANENLASSKDLIENSVKKAEEYAFSKLNINWDIDVVFTNHMPSILIPEDGVGGYTYWKDLIIFCIEEGKASQFKISEMLIHELCHAARWGKNDEWMNSLFDGIINEGLATYFEISFAKNKSEKTFFAKTIIDRTDEENEKILLNLRGELDAKNFDYHTVFFNGDDKLPRWSGYSLGYYLVKKYLEKTGKKIEDAFADKYADFKIVLSRAENLERAN